MTTRLRDHKIPGPAIFNFQFSIFNCFQFGSSIGNRKSAIENGFTLLELMVTMALIVLASSMIYITFGTVTKAWRSGMKLTEDLHHGDFIMEQLVMGLRSTYFQKGGNAEYYGFWLEDDGSGENARDSISWVKRGYALTPTNSPTAAGLHRVKFSIEEEDKGRPAAAVRYWMLPYAMPEDFDPAEIEPEFISSRVCGFNCRIATNRTDEGWEWEDTWEDENTNRLPYAVELTVYLDPLEEDGDPIEIKRLVEIPVAHLSWSRIPHTPTPARRPTVGSRRPTVGRRGPTVRIIRPR